MLTVDGNNQPRPFGPFDINEFLITPALSRRILPLERFILRHVHQTIGLDSLDRRQNPRATAMITSGLQWRGVIYFSDINKKEISRQGMDLLFQSAGATGRLPELDWETGFYVDVKGRYYRHSFESDKESGEVELFMDITQTPGVGKERRFHVTKGSPSFFEDSVNSLAQAQVVRAMELVNQECGGGLRLKNKTVKWYATGYKRLYPKLRTGSETLNSSVALHNSTTIGRDIYSSLASQIDSPSFRDILTQHKRLITIGNLNAFKREVQNVLDHAAEVRGHWGEMMATKRAGLLQSNAANTQNMDSQDSVEDEYPIQHEAGPSSGRTQMPNQPNHDQQIHSNESIPDELIMIDDEDPEETVPDYEVKFDDDIPMWDGANDSTTVGAMEASLPPRVKYSRPDQESIKLLTLLPRYMLDLPQIPPTCRWRCPAKGCNLLLDLKGHLPIEYLKPLTPDEINFLQHSFWTSKTPGVNDMFRRMVGKHFESHLEELGLRFVNDQLRRT